MLFNSLAFMLFLPVIFALYWAFPHKYRWFLLLLASYYFYMSWNAKYIVLILFTTLISYLAALFLERERHPRKRKAVLILVIVCCMGILFFFKYFNFFSSSIAAVLNRFALPVHPVTLMLVLPVGISFYTFQTLSYVLDVYRGKVKAERHFGIYAAFISFFPQLVAGPIERTENLLPQIRARHTFHYDKAMYGMKVMLWGYIKKMVIADLLAGYVDTVFGSVNAYTGFSWVLAVFFFTIQIYCDFSGYSDIALGTAKLLDIDLMTNFKSPYFSASVKEFWSRWHISLSTWFRDYVYIPLGGNRCSKGRQAVNLMATFLCSGLWHGANWTFVLWGAVHGLAQIAENACSAPLKRLRETPVGKWALTAAVFVFCNLAWIFFRADTCADAWYILTHMLQGVIYPRSYLRAGLAQLGINPLKGIYLAGLLLLLALYDYGNKDRDIIEHTFARLGRGQWFFYLVMGLLFVFFSQKGVAAEFVYFQF